MDVKIENGNLVITLPCFKPTVASKSGKTLLVASTRGVKKTECFIDDSPIYIGVNAFYYPPATDPAESEVI